MEKEIFGRLKLNINTPEYWESSTEAPLKGEMIIYQGDIPQIKIGDGVTLAKDLPFVTLTSEEINQLKSSIKNSIGEKAVILNDLESNQAISNYTLAENYNTTAGAKAFRIKSFIDGGNTFILDDENQILEIEKLNITTNPDTKELEGPQVSFQLKDCYDIYSTVKVNTDNTLAITRNTDGTVTVIIKDSLTVKATYPKDEAGNALHWSETKKDENGTTIGVTPYGEGTTYNTFRFVDYPEMGDVDVGSCAHAEGTETQSVGVASHTEGYNTKALSKYSHAEGHSTEAVFAAHSEGQSTKAHGQQSHAEGYNTLAKGIRSHAEGQDTKAIGQMTHAEGYASTANANYSHTEGRSTSTDSAATAAHAEGYQTRAQGMYSHTEGSNTVALKTCAHAEGFDTAANGKYSHSEGNNTTAEAESSHVEGYGSRAEAKNSHAEGKNTVAKGENSHAEGRDTIAAVFNQHVEGRGNIEDSAKKYAHILGIGEYENSTLKTRKNGHTIDWSGNAWFAGDVRVGSSQYDDGKKLATEDKIDEKIATFIDSAPEALNTLKELATALGEDPNFATTVASELGKKADKDNIQWNDIKNAPSIQKGTGYDNTSTVIGSISGADANTASQPYAFAEGQGTTASGLYAHAEGKNTTAEGHGSHAEGSGTYAKGIRSHAEGLDTKAIGHNSHAEGDSTIARGQSQHVQGVGNVEDINGEFLHIIGNGWIDEENQLHRSNAHTVDWKGNAWYAGDVRVGENWARVIDELEIATGPSPLKVIKNSDNGIWTPTLDNTNPETQDKIVINANETIQLSLPEKMELNFSVASDDTNPVTFIVYEGEVNITPDGILTLPPDYPLEFTKGKEARNYTVEVTNGTLKIFNFIGNQAGIVAPGGDVNLTNGVITIKDEVKESLGGPKVVTRTSTKIGYASGDELLCNTKYYCTEALDMVYFHDDLFKGSGENGAKQIGDEWEINFYRNHNSFSISSDAYMMLNMPFNEFTHTFYSIRIKYAGTHYLGFIEQYSSNNAE